MKPFRDLPLRQKLRRVVMIVAVLSAFFMGLSLTVYEVVEVREEQAAKLEALGRVLGAAATPAVLFDDFEAAERELGRLRAVPEVVFAVLAAVDGTPIASYQGPTATFGVLSLFSGLGSMEVAWPLEVDREVVGRLVIRADLSPGLRTLVVQMAVTGAVGVATLLLVLALLARLERGFTAPILDLVRVMERVRRTEDFSARAQKVGEDEVGALVDGFNLMLAGIASRDDELARQQLRLEQEVAVRTQALLEANARLQSELHERRNTEARLRQLAQVFDNTEDGVLIVDRDLRIRAVNGAFTRITGYAGVEALGEAGGRLLVPRRHARSFYAKLGEHLDQVGRWRGEVWGRHKDGTTFPALLTVSAVRDGQGDVINYIAVFSDITALKQSEARLHHLAHHDALTGLPNRNLFVDRLGQAVARAERGRWVVALLFLDLDRFKYVNDTLGHAAGDQLLCDVAERLRACVRESDTVARLGGDEFTVILEGLSRPEEAAEVADKVLASLRRPVTLSGQEVLIGGSIGISLYPPDGTDTRTLIQHADAAMYDAKEAGKNTHRFYHTGLTTRSAERLDLEARLWRALERDEFDLYYQPKVKLPGGEITGSEALIRWRHPEWGLVRPDRFIPVAEETGLIGPIGEWALRHACRQQARWHKQGRPVVPVAVNISGRQILQGRLAETVARILAETECATRYLELEVTEGFLIEDPERGGAVLQDLKALGIRLTIDDFGTGYSSLAYLQRLPLDVVKIDRSFIRHLPTDREGAAIVQAVVALAHSLDLKVIAEGVETEAQSDFLNAQDCDEAQGYYFSPPRPAGEFEGLMTEWRAGVAP